MTAVSRSRAPGSALGGLLATLCGLVLAACVAPAPSDPVRDGFVDSGFPTFAKYLPRAQAGDPKYQNLLGFMRFFGEGVPMDRTQAHTWFHLAADQDYPPARRNLAIMHRYGLGVRQDRSEARRYADDGRIEDLAWLASKNPASRKPRPPHPGERTYATFCAGCHGLNGVAAYIESPSFALGERMEKDDPALLHSIRNGLGVMPGWGGKLPERSLHDVLAFIRRFQPQYNAGIGQVLRGAPRQFFLFGPMLNNDAAYRGGLE